MMMKKKLAALLLAAASAMVFTGCGSSDNQSKGSVDKKVQIEYWHVASESFGGATVKELVADFNAKHPNIQVVEKYNPDMYKGLTQNLQAAIASGKNPDVVQMGWSYLNYAAENLKYTDLQPMIEKQAPEDKNFLKENYLPNVLALAQTDDGKQIGIPYSISVPVLFYNPEIFTAAGLDPNNPPKTWKEVVNAAKQIKEKTGNMGFFMQEYADNWTQQAIIESNGGSMLKNEGGKVKAGFDTPEAAEAYQLLADMVKDGNGLHATNEEGFQAYLSGKLGMVCTTIGKRANFEKSAKFKVMAPTTPAPPSSRQSMKRSAIWASRAVTFWSRLWALATFLACCRSRCRAASSTAWSWTASPDALPSSFIPRRTLPSRALKQRTEKTSMTSPWATSRSDNIR